MNASISSSVIGVIGLGYVGLPLAVELGKGRRVIGFDIDERRINDLKRGVDTTNEVEANILIGASNLEFTSDASSISQCNVFIVTVPTPIDENNLPNLEPLKSASSLVAGILKTGDTVIYESTVYPGATEEICVPILEGVSGLELNIDFFVGYSPERINPGDKVNTLTTIKKITSGSNESSAKFIDDLYASIISAGTHRASSIKVAEAAKVIENTQRDLNIAVINEFAKIFNILKIDTQQVLDAASTKWNFLPFKPGLVGGHCISVDPYYLTYKAKEVGYQPEVILAGRRINDGMGVYVASQLIKAMIAHGIKIDGAKVLVLGFTFKGDCPDVRNTKIADVVEELSSFGLEIDVYDSWADPVEVFTHYRTELISDIPQDHYDGIVVAVDHSEFKAWGSEKIRGFGKSTHILYDVKYVLGHDAADIRL